MKKSFKYLLLILPLLTLTSCNSFFDKFKNSTGTFTNDLVVTSFEHEDGLSLLQGKEKVFNYKTNSSSSTDTLSRDSDTSYEYIGKRNAGKTWGGLVLSVTKADDIVKLDNIDTKLENGDYYEYNAENDKYTQTLYHNTLGYDTELTKAEFDEKIAIIDTYYSKAKSIYSEVLVCFEEYKTDPEKYSFSYQQKNGSWYIILEYEKEDIIYYYSLAYGSFAYQISDEESQNFSYLQFIYKSTKSASTNKDVFRNSITYQFDTTISAY